MRKAVGERILDCPAAAPTPELDSTHVVFGELLAGEEFLQQAERLPVLRELRGVIGVHVTCFFLCCSASVCCNDDPIKTPVELWVGPCLSLQTKCHVFICGPPHIHELPLPLQPPWDASPPGGIVGRFWRVGWCVA